MRFWRIRGCDYYRNPEESLDSLWQALSEMGIRTQSETVIDDENLPEHDRRNIVGDISQSPQSSDRIRPVDTAASREEEKPISQTPLPLDSMAQQQQTRETKPKSITPRVTKSEIYNYPPDFFFELAHWAKEEKELEPWQRRLIFDVGRYRSQGWQVTEKMERQALRIIQKALEAGFSGVADQMLNKEVGEIRETKERNKMGDKLPRDFLYRVKKLRDQGHSLDEIGKRYGLSAEEVQLEISRGQQELKIALAPLMEELSRDAPSIRTVANGTADRSTIEGVSRDLLRNILDEILSALTDQQSILLKLRFGLVDGRSHTVKEIGKGFNLPKNRIKQIERNALHRLRHPIYKRRINEATGLSGVSAYELLYLIAPVCPQ